MVPQAPLLLPKLCIFITIRTPLDKPFKSMTVRILKDNEVFHEQPIDPAAFAVDDTPPPELGDDPKSHIQIFATTVVFSPFPIDRSFILRVRMITDGEELRGPGLLIRVHPGS